MQLVAANMRRDNAEAQVARLGAALEGVEAELRDAYRKLEAAEERIEQLERQLSDGGLRFTLARENYLPARVGTGCKACAVWSPEKLSLDEFAALSHQFGCPLDPDYEPLSPFAGGLREGF